MSVAPSPSSARGEVVLQPAYFTSSAFVHPARADVDGLVQEYAQRYTHSPTRPFALFKQVWQRTGWTWMHFKVFDTRSRAVFLSVVMRLFSERVGADEPPLKRAAALFGLYAALRSQPSSSTPTLYTAAQAQVTCDVYAKMLALPDELGEVPLKPIRPHVVCVLSRLVEAQVFQILPHSLLHPSSPRTLPREDVVEDAVEVRRTKGRPSKREMIKRRRESLAALERWGAGRDERAGLLR